MPDPNSIIAENLAHIRGRISQAATRSGRNPDEVTLVAVTKYVPSEIIESVIQAGCLDLGESRPQDFWGKAQALQGHNIRWHMIGHLQRNKVSRTVALTTLIHSVDSEPLLAEIDRAAGQLQRRPAVLLEINISGEVTKHGLSPEQSRHVVSRLPLYPNVHVRGLMGMASLDGDADRTRAEFESLRQLRETLRQDCPPCATMDELSMGMSGDFEIAIEAGATLVRIGSSLYDGLML